MKNLVLLILLDLLILGCNNKYSKLADYYRSNKLLHENISNALIELSSKNKTDFIIRKRPDLGDKIVFLFYSKEVNTYYAIDFDSKFRRVDLDSEYTSGVLIPISLIENISKTRYTAIKSDSTEVFFGDTFLSDGNSQIGILFRRNYIGKETDCKLVLDSNICINAGLIP